MQDIICAAIRSLELLAFDYDGRARVVAPYCHGFTGNGEALRAIQVRGESRSGPLRSGKLWMVEKMTNVRKLAENFAPDDPDYNPNDSALLRIHCRVQR